MTRVDVVRHGQRSLRTGGQPADDRPRRPSPVLGEWPLTDGRITGVKINFDDGVDENAVKSPPWWRSSPIDALHDDFARRRALLRHHSNSDLTKFNLDLPTTSVRSKMRQRHIVQCRQFFCNTNQELQFTAVILETENVLQGGMTKFPRNLNF